MAHDRNERARAEFRQRQDLARMQREFMAAAARGDIKPIDRFGAPIEIGSLVVWHPSFDLMFLVTDMKPLLAPHPPGLVEMTLSVTVPAQAQINQPIMGMIKVGQQKVADDGVTMLDEKDAPVVTDAGGQASAPVEAPPSGLVGADGRPIAIDARQALEEAAASEEPSS